MDPDHGLRSGLLSMDEVRRRREASPLRHVLPVLREGLLSVADVARHIMVVADDEGRVISPALGDGHSILLAHHGLLTAGRSVEEACYLAVLFERAARLQVRAQAAGTIRDIDPALAREAGAFLRKDSIVRATFAYWSRRVGGL